MKEEKQRAVLQEQGTDRTKKVLIIGEHSYIGTSFYRYAQKHAPFLAVEMVSARNDAWKKEKLGEYDAVIHLAAIVHRKETPDSAEEYRRVNTVLPLEVAEQAKQAGVGKFVFFSTMAVYGQAKSPITAETDTNPVTLYGKSKLEAEKQLNRIADQTFCVSVLRPPMVYGIKCPGNYHRLAKLAYILPLFPKVRNERSMIYIENLCACICSELTDEDDVFRIVCPQNTEYVNTSLLVKEIRKCHGKNTILVPGFSHLIRWAAVKVGILDKVFGDCYYEREDESSSIRPINFEESIRMTEKGSYE